MDLSGFGDLPVGRSQKLFGCPRSTALVCAIARRDVGQRRPFKPIRRLSSSRYSEVWKVCLLRSPLPAASSSFDSCLAVGDPSSFCSALRRGCFLDYARASRERRVDRLPCRRQSGTCRAARTSTTLSRHPLYKETSVRVAITLLHSGIGELSAMIPRFLIAPSD